LGIERHHAVPRREEAGVGAVAERSAAPGRRQPVAVLGARPLGARLRHAGLRELREGPLRPRRPGSAGSRARRAGGPDRRPDTGRTRARPRLAGRKWPDARRLLRRSLADLRGDRTLPAGRIRRDRALVPRPGIASRLAKGHRPPATALSVAARNGRGFGARCPGPALVLAPPSAAPRPQAAQRAAPPSAAPPGGRGH